MIRRTALACLLSALLLLASCSAPTAGPSASPAAPSSSPADASSGILSVFTATDLEGNEVDQSIFSGHSVTMVNIWGTFCPPCIDEMPDLAALNTEYADRGFQVVGLVSDLLDQDGSISESQLATARDIVDTTGADYLHLQPGPDFYSLLGQVSALPATLFVDENGIQIGSAYLGAKEKDKWAAVIEPLLEAMEK